MSKEAATRDIHIFPLNTVLFPDGVLPLKIFEQRYLDMTKACLRDNAPFGVCLIREGSEVGRPAVPHPVGTVATITQWDMPQLGVFHLETRGGARFRVLETQVSTNGLVSGRVEILSEDAAAEMDEACQQVLKAIIDKAGAQHFPAPLRIDDPAWVSYRLAEVLPLELPARQALLEMDEPAERFGRLREVLIRQAILTPGE